MRAAHFTRAASAVLSRSALVTAMVLSAAMMFSCGEEKPADSWVAPEPCNLPFDAGDDNCFVKISVWTYDGSACVKRLWNGCGGNANRFDSQELCLATCEGRPAQRPCTDNRVSHDICLACSATGGCGVHQLLCAKACATNEDCASSEKFTACVGGFCQVPGC